MNSAVSLVGLLCVLLMPGAECDEIACPRQVTGELYGIVSIQCLYSSKPAANKYVRKYCCLQGARPGSCKYTVVSTTGYINNDFISRVNIKDETEKSRFTVTIDNLKKGDEGTYVCGLGIPDNQIKNIVILSVVEDSIIPMDTQLIYTQIRGTAIFKCEYKGTTQTRHLCKVTKTGCINVIDSTGRTGSRYEGRVSADSRQAGMFIVKMAQVQDLDVGFYTCSSDNPEASINPNYEIRINTVTDIPQVNPLLTPRLGGSLSAQCYYDPKQNYTHKFWCKLEDGVCNPIITKEGDVKDTYEGRVVIYDNATAGLMQVLMDNISPKDEGWYWCVLGNGMYDQTSAIRVRITTENIPGLSGSKRVRAAVGDPAKLTCSYPCRFRKSEKFWCQWSNLGCLPLSNVEDTQNPQLVDCKTEELSLNFESVSLKDSKTYFCGVKNGDKYVEVFGVQLIVEEPTGGAPNTNVRANFNAIPGSEEAVETPASTDNNNGIVTAVVVSVCVALLVAGAVFLLLRFRRRKNSDLVSVGSYRTNISMTDLDNNVGKENPVATDLQETDIGRSEGSPKSKKKGSREDLDYSCFLINHTGAPNEQVA